MDKKEAKKLGAWISLLGGLCFVAGAAAAIYVAFFIPPQRATDFLFWMSRLIHR